ncbi:f-box only protein 21, partial [Lasius niger]
VKSDILINKLSKREGKKIKFAVGLIVSHYGYPFLEDLESTKEMCSEGVIIAWYYNDQHADKIGFGVGDWNKLMFRHLVTPDGDPLYYPDFYCCIPNNRFNVPHYMILAENNGVCLVPEDDISICSPKLIDNVEIGRFFFKFEGTHHYVPNERLRKAYPNDTAVIP